MKQTRAGSFLHLCLLLPLILLVCGAAPAGQTAPAVSAVGQNAPAVAPAPPAAPDPCEEGPQTDTLASCDQFLQACPSSPRRQEVLARMGKLIEKQHGGYDAYKKFVMEYGDGAAYVPYQQQLELVGPEGLRVHDCLEELKSGADPGIVLDDVRRKHGMYKDFTFEEIDMLKKMGLTSDLIQAMIESTLDAERAETTLPAAGQASGAAGDGAYAAPAPGQYAPSPSDELTNCASQAAALEGCKRMSGLARSICENVAQSQFPCQ